MMRRLRGFLPAGVRERLEAREIEALFASEIAAARKTGNHRQIESLEYERSEELRAIYEAEDSRYTRRLVRQANRLRVPLPSVYSERGEETGFWETSSRTGSRYLTDAGVTQLRAAIREEARWTHEQRNHWITWISALTGLIGAITGLAAILSK